MKNPRSWRIEQQITTIDGSTFPMYYTNMRSQLAEMVKNSEMIIMNRCDGVQDLNTYKRNIKAVNPRADVIFEDANGEITDILEDDLPYDLSAEVLKLDDNGYGIWFLDIMDHPERYEGKTVEFLAMVLKPKDFPKNYFLPGRMAMTCCAEDISFLGYACEYEGADALKQKEWVKVKAVVHRKYWADYQGEGLVLTAVSVEKAKAPKKRSSVLIKVRRKNEYFYTGTGRYRFCVAYDDIGSSSGFLFYKVHERVRSQGFFRICGGSHDSGRCMVTSDSVY